MHHNIYNLFAEASNKYTLSSRVLFLQLSVFMPFMSSKFKTPPK